MAAAPRKSRLEALSEELRLFSPQAGEIKDETALNKGFRGARLAALCLSGGGIRSASFCLGVIQALAEARLLAQFNYLSTVSGGGYIGSWLHKLINQEPSHDPKEVQGRLPSSDAITTCETIRSICRRRAACSRSICGPTQCSGYATPC